MKIWGIHKTYDTMNWSTQHPSVTELRPDKNTCDTLESCQEIEEMAKTLTSKKLA